MQPKNTKFKNTIPENSATPDWIRLREVIEESGMSVNAFALHIGLPRSENLYQIKKGNHGISKALAEQINRFYPSFSVGWLLSGDAGAKLPPDADHIELRNDSLKRFPVYSRIKNGTKPIYHLYLSERLSNDAGQAVINNDESLAPRIPVGALVFLKQSEKLIFGKYYLFQTPEMDLIRKVSGSPNPDEIRLSTEDGETYDDIVLSPAEIENQYLVVKVLSDI